MLEIRCIKCRKKISEVESDKGLVIINSWCVKSECKTKNKYVIVDGKIVARIVYGQDVINKIRKV